ncbi:MAG: hypothetical protein HC937_02900 [Aquincola sp.]|nr:hypothetical protein [Aquincola sp.]
MAAVGISQRNQDGAIGCGFAVAWRDGAGGREYALIVEALAIRPVKLKSRADLRIVSASAQPVLVLASSAEPWAVASSADATIKGSTAYSSRQSYPVIVEQLSLLRQSEKPIVEIVHAEGIIALKLRAAELKLIDEIVTP